MTTSEARKAGSALSGAGASIGAPTKARLEREVKEAPISRMKYKNLQPYRKMERELGTLPQRKDDPGSGRTAKRKSEKARSSGR